MTAPASAHPRSIADLYPGALALADQLGEVPSRNRLMKEFKIGVPKATELRELLLRPVDGHTDDGQDLPDPWLHAEPIGPDPDPVDVPDEPSIDNPADPGTEPVVEQPEQAQRADASQQVRVDGHPGTPTPAKRRRPVAAWPVILLALPAFVAVWSGWVGLGGLTGFGVVHPLPGIWDEFSIDTAITLPIGVETYGAYALYVWLSGRVPDRARRFAKWSALGSLAVGAAGQVAYHLLVEAGVTSAPWWITTAVSVLPVAVLGMGAALAHLVREER
ncbi:ABC transporter permease [Verrucosispora sp. NA02020]|uniref:ABC transporter permease n=1 Tax=Verrucosispora sp. NA02020 TaxID=2742132 RepID=UPI003D722B27